jgi:hypothetical protein
VPALVGAQTPQPGLQQISPEVHATSPQSVAPGAQICGAQAAPSGAQMLQAALQQYSPAAHVASPQLPPPHDGATSVHRAVWSQYMSTVGSTQLMSAGSQGLQGAPHGLPSQGLYEQSTGASRQLPFPSQAEGAPPVPVWDEVQSAPQGLPMQNGGAQVTAVDTQLPRALHLKSSIDPGGVQSAPQA